MSEFIKNMLSNQDNISSKRITAIFLILIYVNITYLSIWKELSENTIHMADTVIYVAVLLFTGAVVEKFKR